MKLFCDMDGVLVHQTGRDRFDKMPWMPDGRQLWDAIKGSNPTILSMLRPDIYEKCAPEKRAWCARELGADVPVIVTPDRVGKGPYSEPGAILIDDDVHRHAVDWRKGGGLYLHHRAAHSTIAALRAAGAIP